MKKRKKYISNYGIFFKSQFVIFQLIFVSLYFTFLFSVFFYTLLSMSHNRTLLYLKSYVNVLRKKLVLIQAHTSISCNRLYFINVVFAGGQTEYCPSFCAARLQSPYEWLQLWQPSNSGSCTLSQMSQTFHTALYHFFVWHSHRPQYMQCKMSIHVKAILDSWDY